jgi:hypothetical protein
MRFVESRQVERPRRHAASADFDAIALFVPIRHIRLTGEYDEWSPNGHAKNELLWSAGALRVWEAETSSSPNQIVPVPATALRRTTALRRPGSTGTRQRRSDASSVRMQPRLTKQL